MRYFEDQKQMESFLHRFVTDWQTALHRATDRSELSETEEVSNEP